METLRLRLDGLRKAKNTTIVKREREPALVPLSPKLGQRGLFLAEGGKGGGKERRGDCVFTNTMRTYVRDVVGVHATVLK